MTEFTIIAEQFDLRIDLSRNKIEEKVGQKPFVYLAQGII